MFQEQASLLILGAMQLCTNPTTDKPTISEKRRGRVMVTIKVVTRVITELVAVTRIVE